MLEFLFHIFFFTRVELVEKAVSDLVGTKLHAYLYSVSLACAGVFLSQLKSLMVCRVHRKQVKKTKFCKKIKKSFKNSVLTRIGGSAQSRIICHKLGKILPAALGTDFMCMPGSEGRTDDLMKSVSTKIQTLQGPDFVSQRGPSDLHYQGIGYLKSPVQSNNYCRGICRRTSNYGLNT